MELRKATVKDIPILMEIRKKQLIDEGISPSCKIDEELKRFFTKQMASDTMVEWVYEDEGMIVATGAIVFYDFPPTYTNPTGRKGYITNMYTHPHYRRRHLASSLLTVLKEEALSRGVTKLWLGASSLGRPVYERFGFQPTSVWMDMDL